MATYEGLGGVADKQACTVHTVNVISQLWYLVSSVSVLMSIMSLVPIVAYMHLVSARRKFTEWFRSVDRRFCRNGFTGLCVPDTTHWV
jgi:hypothetical protein